MTEMPAPEHRAKIIATGPAERRHEAPEIEISGASADWPDSIRPSAGDASDQHGVVRQRSIGHLVFQYRDGLKVVTAAVEVDLHFGAATGHRLGTQEPAADQIETVIAGEAREHRVVKRDLVLRAARCLEVCDGIDAVGDCVVRE